MSVVRVSLGAEYTDMPCFGCGWEGACALIAKNGSVYISCRYCRMKSFGLHIRAVESYRLLLEALKDVQVRANWVRATAEAEVRRWTQIPARAPAEAPAPAGEEVSRGA